MLLWLHIIIKPKQYLVIGIISRASFIYVFLCDGQHEQHNHETMTNELAKWQETRLIASADSSNKNFVLSL